MVSPALAFPLNDAGSLEIFMDDVTAIPRLCKKSGLPPPEKVGSRFPPLLQSASSQPVSPYQDTTLWRRFPAVFGRDLDGARVERGWVFSPKLRRVSGP
jgi:hypothetical protein